MKKYGLLCLLFLFLFGSSSLFAQMYYQEGRQLCCGDSLLAGNALALEINPSQLGRVQKQKQSLRFLQFGANFYSNDLSLGELLTFAFSEDSLSRSIQNELLQAETEQPFLFNGNIDLTWLSFSIASSKAGGFAFRLKDRVNSYASLPTDLLGLLILGDNAPVYQQSTPEQLQSVANGSRMFYSHIREASLGYGRKLYSTAAFSLYVGATIKKYWGVGYFNTQIENNQISGLSSFSEFYQINYGTLDLSQDFRSFQRQFLSSTGGGLGFDFGLTAELGKSFQLSASVMDMGRIRWEEKIISSRADFGQYIQRIDDGIIQTLNFDQELGQLYESFRFEEGLPFDVALNTQLRMNMSYLLKERLTMNADLLLPLYSQADDILNYQPATYAGNLTYVLVPSPLNLNLSSGVFYSKLYDFRVPLGISLNLGRGADFGISTTDLLTFFSKEKDPFPGLSVTGLTFLF